MILNEIRPLRVECDTPYRPAGLLVLLPLTISVILLSVLLTWIQGHRVALFFGAVLVMAALAI